jgi:ATP synthase subunit 6
MEQFEIFPLFSLGLGPNFAITNATAFGVIVLLIAAGFLSCGTGEATLVPNRWQSMAEGVYSLALDTLRDSVGPKGAAYFPWIFASFLMIMMCNLVGMIPYTFTLTSHIAVTFGFAGATFIGINIVAFRAHGLHFFSFFVPKDVPAALLPLIVVIEVISYVFRLVSLAVRLFANMMAGHSLLKILAGFVWTLLSLGGIFAVLQLAPFAAMIAVTILELGVAFLHAYVWTTLVCIYLGDAIHLAH